jgi:outer membrane receptor protein involved in Fe transport
MARFTVLVLIMASLAAPPRAAGQQRDTTHHDTLGVTTPIVLDPIEVRGSIVPVAGPTVGSGVPARVSIVTGPEIAAWEPRLLADVLASQAGVSLYDDLGSSYKLNLSTRGFSAGPTVGVPHGVSVFLDGVRQNEPDAQEINFDLLPMEHVQRVELLSGNASLLGPNSLGGAVNLITLRGGGPFTGALEASGGSFGAASAEGSLSGRVADRWAYYAGGGYEREDGWRDATDADNYNAFANLGRLGEVRGLQLQAFGAKSRAATAGSLPESIFDTSPSTNFTPGDFEDLNAEQVAVSGYAPVGPGRGSFAAYYRQSRAERFNVNQAPDDNVRGLTANNTGGGNLDWRGTARAATVALRAGIDAEANSVRVRLYGEPQNGSTSALTTDVESPSWSLAGYGLADLRAGRATVSLGARYDYVRVPFRNLLDSSDDTTSTFSRFNPRGGVTIDVGGGTSLYASVGQTFRAPAILELGCADPAASCPLPFALGEDPPLKPVRATTYELGGRWARGSLLLNGSVYRSDVRDEIFFVASEGTFLSGYFTNISETRRWGAELSANLTIGGWFVAYANYAYTSATFRTPVELFSIRSDSDFAGSALAGPNEVEQGDGIPLVPDHQIKEGALVRLGDDFELGMNGRFIGQQWLRGDEANETGPLDSYFIADARIGYDVGPWEVVMVLTNLLDTRSAVFGTFNENRQTGELERFLTPAGARTVKLTVRRKFGPGGATASK